MADSTQLSEMKKYFTYIGYNWQGRNKLDEAIREFLKTQNRLIITETDLEGFKRMILEKIDELSRQFNRCKPTKGYWWMSKLRAGDSNDDSLSFDGVGSCICSFSIYECEGDYKK